MSQNPLETIEIETGANPQASVIWMHGLGADGNDFVPIVQRARLCRRARHPLRVSARADAAGDDQQRLRDARVVRHQMGRPRRPIEAGRRKGRARVAGRDRGADRARSRTRHRSEASCSPDFRRAARSRCRQGCATPRSSPASWRCRLICRSRKRSPRSATAENRKTPIFMAHGTQDNVVPYQMGVRSRDVLLQHGYDVEVARVPDAALRLPRREYSI